MAIFTNQASLSFNGTTINSNIVTGNIVDVLAVSKTAVGDSYSANDSVTYIVSITNSSTTPFTGITVSDNLGEYPFGSGSLVPLEYVENSVVYYQNGVLQPAPTVTSVSPLVFTGITVPAGGNVTLVYEARTNSFAPLYEFGSIVNTVSVTASSITAPITDSETITVTNIPILTITKGLCPLNVTENSELTYTFTIQNTGNTAAVATDNIIVSDTFDPILSAITVTLNGTVLPNTAYTYNEATGEFATVAGVITIPAATYTQDPVTGSFTVNPGVTTLTVTGTV